MLIVYACPIVLGVYEHARYKDTKWPNAHVSVVILVFASLIFMNK